MASNYQILIISLFLVSQSISIDKCPKFQPLLNLNLDRYLGTWYLMNRFTYSPQTMFPNLIVCQKEIYTRNGFNPYLITLKTTSERTGNEINGLISIDPQLNSVWTVLKNLELMESRIIATDYDNWSLELSCSISDLGLGSESMTYTVALRTRNATLNHQMTEALKIYDISTLPPSIAQIQCSDENEV